MHLLTRSLLFASALSFHPCFGQGTGTVPPASEPAVAPAAALPPSIPAARDSLFQPTNFKSLGVLSVPSGKSVTFDTGTASSMPSVSGAVSGAGALGVSQGGQVQLAVFCFDSIQIAQGAEVTVTGDRGLVLLSKGAAAVHAKIDLSGGPGNKGKGSPVGPGGPGGEGGEYAKTLASNPPPADGGDGGPSMKDNGKPGRGFGAGFNRRVKGGVAGGGGGYGGPGGETSEGSKPMGGQVGSMPGGSAYGDAALKELFGGSGGAGGSNDRAMANGSGGGGGGSVALVALQSITLGPKSAILARGGPGGVDAIGGGGGSGGAILLASPVVQLQSGAILDVGGGAGGDGGPAVAAEIQTGTGRRNSGSGGGGGGGRIAIYTTADFGEPGKQRAESKLPSGIVLAGGKGGSEAKDGQPGTCFDGSWPGLR